MAAVSLYSTESITRNSVKYLFRVIRRVMWEAMVIPETAEGKEIRYRIVKRPLLFCGYKDSITPIREEPQ